MGSTTKISIKLKFLSVVSSERVDTGLIIKDLMTYNRWKFWKIFSLVRFLRDLTIKINEIRAMDFKEVPENKDCHIKRPSNIDLIPFSAMIELQQYFGGVEGSTQKMETLISNVIALVCYSENREKPFDSSSKEYEEFLQEVLHSDLIDMMAIYKWIEKALDTSSSLWGQKFKDVETVNKDYDSAGGSRMDQFNVLTTIKNTALDFNIPYTEALLMSYGMTQANSLSKATANHIQEVMTKIIEARMKQERAKGTN
jgi:hypothetical protein